MKTVHDSCKSPEKYEEECKHSMEFPHRVITPVSSGADLFPEIFFFFLTNAQRQLNSVLDK